VVSFDSYFLLGLGGKVCYFLLVITFKNYFLLSQEGQGVKGSIHCARGEVERVQKLIFFLIFFTIEGGGGKGVHLGFRETQVFFIMEWLGRGSAGVKVAFLLPVLEIAIWRT
jgi:hypothetical protein